MAEKTKLAISLVITLCIAIAAGVWAITGEIDNYRLANITDRLKSHEDTIIEGTADRSMIWRAIDQLVVITGNLKDRID